MESFVEEFQRRHSDGGITKSLDSRLYFVRDIAGANHPDEGYDATEPLIASVDDEIHFIFAGLGSGVHRELNMKTSWYGLRAPEESRFISSDHPMLLFDSLAPPNTGVGWLSSPSVEATFPLDPSYCLLITPGPPRYIEAKVETMHVDEINLRTYASAQWEIYGQSASQVQSVRRAAKRNPRGVFSLEPRALGATMLEEVVKGSPIHKGTILRGPKRATRERRRGSS
jgi:hypothetical protein